MNNTSPPHTQFFQKPVYSAMGLLAVLGETQVHATLSGMILRLIIFSPGVYKCFCVNYVKET